MGRHGLVLSLDNWDYRELRRNVRTLGGVVGLPMVDGPFKRKGHHSNIQSGSGWVIVVAVEKPTKPRRCGVRKEVQCFLAGSSSNELDAWAGLSESTVFASS